MHVSLMLSRHTLFYATKHQPTALLPSLLVSLSMMAWHSRECCARCVDPAVATDLCAKRARLVEALCFTITPDTLAKPLCLTRADSSGVCPGLTGGMVGSSASGTLLAMGHALPLLPVPCLELVAHGGS